MPSAEFRPSIAVIKRLQTYALDRAANGIGLITQNSVSLSQRIDSVLVASINANWFMLFKETTVVYFVNCEKRINTLRGQHEEPSVLNSAVRMVATGL
jgi:hypothetical protein